MYETPDLIATTKIDPPSISIDLLNEKMLENQLNDNARVLPTANLLTALAGSALLLQRLLNPQDGVTIHLNPLFLIVFFFLAFWGFTFFAIGFFKKTDSVPPN